MPFVLDTSATIPWAFGTTDIYAAYVRRLLIDDEAYVPPIWAFEVANALLVAERKGMLDAASRVRFFALLRQLDIIVEAAGVERTLSVTLDLARAEGLTAYDAAYLELARREGVPLATQDGALRAAATRQGVPLIESR